MRRVLLAGVVALALLVAVVPNASATTTWTARLGSYGVATIRVGSPDRLSINIKNFRARIVYPVSLRRGTCARLGTLVWSTKLTSSSTGTLVRTVSLTRAQTAAARLPLSIRVGTKCGAFSAPAPAPTPTPTPTPTATPLASPTPTPSGGGTLFAGVGYAMVIPEGWTVAPGGDSSTVRFEGPGSQQMGVISAPTTLTLDAVTARIIANIKSRVGVDPEQTEAVTMDGMPALLLTYHFVNNGLNVHQLDVHTVNNGRVFEITFANLVGSESADRTFVLGIVASFKFLAAAF